MPTGILIDPMGHNPVALTAEEHKNLRRFLDLTRTETPVAEAIEWLLDTPAPKDGTGRRILPAQPNEKGILTWLLAHIGQSWGSVLEGAEVGILASQLSDVAEVLTVDELRVLVDTLTVVRLGGWFA